MKNHAIQAFVFDVYGTLFDVHSISKKCNELFPGKGQLISRTWREKQIEYSNLRQLMGNYKTFYSITKDALRYAVKKNDEHLNHHSEIELMNTYLHLSTYPEVKTVLSRLKDKKLAVFSNGSHDMLDPLLHQSDISRLFTEIISVDEVKQYKPTPASYNHAANVLNAKPEEVLFMSSNGWDISGAKNFGFQTAWINRKNLPVEELNLAPDTIYEDLTGILEWN
ncbi:2-haloacid dehalogenase [Salinibacillus kushneri]|uniref:2-haloacid dehalogenase n=1 Tax=Salinibacillus kushneri TaxID=237682 RepID=A0A1I0DK14_9BACI|nr:haloacid dehalogenase type II [Salinibacillus kushneri]SET32605.1 2-haloacid dehalogenase [Salinibacillus kushneri]